MDTFTFALGEGSPKGLQTLSGIARVGGYGFGDNGAFAARGLNLFHGFGVIVGKNLFKRRAPL